MQQRQWQKFRKKDYEKRRSVGNETVKKASKDLPRRLWSSAPTLTAATPTLTVCVHQERDRSKVCLSKKKKKKIPRKASRDRSTIPASNFLQPFTLARPLTGSPSAARLWPGCLKSAAHADCCFFLRRNRYLLRPDEPPRKTPGKEVTSAGVPSFLPSFLKHANNDHSSELRPNNRSTHYYLPENIYSLSNCYLLHKTDFSIPPGYGKRN